MVCRSVLHPIQRTDRKQIIGDPAAHLQGRDHGAFILYIDHYYFERPILS